MSKLFTITIEVTAEQGEKIFKMLAGTKSRQAEYQERRRKVSIQARAKVVAKEKNRPYTVWEVEPSLYPKEVKDPRTLLINQLPKEMMVPSYQDLSGVSPDDPNNETLLSNGNRFGPQDIAEFTTYDEALAYAEQYAKEEGIDLTLPGRFSKYYEVA